MNWTYKGREVKSAEDLPPDSIGFIYIIRNLTNSKEYYGRKAVRRLAKKKLTKKEKELPENKRKTYKYVYVEYKDWKKYTGSSEALNSDISKGDKYEKEIIKACSTKAEMTYNEAKVIICSNCLERSDCYNDWVSARVYKKNLKLDE